MIQLDNTDKQILRMLQKNAKLTTKEIAFELGLTNTPVYERIKRLERHKIIKGYVAIVDRRKIEKNLIGFCSVALKEHSREYLMNFEEEIKQFEEVLECYHITGKFDYLIKIAVRDMEGYHSFTFNRLAKLAHVGNVHTIFAMNDIKFTTALKIE